MPNFENTLAELSARRNSLEIARENLYVKKEAVSLQEQRIAYLLKKERLRYLPEDHPEQQKLIQLKKEVDPLRIAFQEAAAAAAEAERQFAELGSPQELITNLDDGLPILLAPVRVQVRFARVKHLTTNFTQNDLLDLSASNHNFNTGTFHDLQRELANDQVFSIPNYSSIEKDFFTPGYYSATKLRNAIKAEEIGPASGRWLKIVPDTYECWIRIYPDDISIHKHETALSPREKMAGEDFWKRWWHIHKEDKNALKKELENDVEEKPLTLAWIRLQRSFQFARAAWIFKATMPSNYNDEDTDYEQAPVFEQNPKLRGNIWTKPLRSFVMPDRFVVRIYQRNLQKEFVGKKIPHPLQLSPTPEEGADFDEVKWIHDFEEAEKIGMGVRIPLLQNRINVGVKIDKIVVLGVKTSADEKTSQTLLEELLDNHSHSGSGMAILPKGTPTNNFADVKSGYSSDGVSPEDALKTIAGKPLFIDRKNTWRSKKDGQYLTDALGIAANSFFHIHNSDATDISNCVAMNHLLWPATMGYFLHQFLQPTLTPKQIAQTRDFFVDHIAGTGFIPTIRVGKQPYGILAASSFSNWQFEMTDDHFVHQLYTGVLEKLDQHWGKLMKEVKTITDPKLIVDKFSKEFIKILGLSAGSQSLTQRPVVGEYFLEDTTGASFATKPKYVNENSITPTWQRNNWDPDVNAWINHTYDVLRPRYFKPGLKKDMEELLGFSFKTSDFNREADRLFDLHFSKLVVHRSANVFDPKFVSGKKELPKAEGSDLNYLQLLKEASLQQLKEEHFSKISPASGYKPLLYLLARQALSRTYLELGVSLISHPKKQISLIDFELEHLGDDPLPWRESQDFLSRFPGVGRQNLGNWTWPNEVADPSSFLYRRNKWDYLAMKTPETGDLTIGEFLEGKIKSNNRAKRYAPLINVKSALTALQNEPTIALEQAFLQHLDVCSYRLDSWMYGLVNRRLSQQREKRPKGIYLGAFGYLENIDPINAYVRIAYRTVADPEYVETPEKVNAQELVIPYLHFDSFTQNNIDLDQLLNKGAIYIGDDRDAWEKITRDSTGKLIPKPVAEPQNQGFIHTPSPDHAVTAAILRSGYMANRPQGATDQFAINLNSERVRKALFLIQGMKKGQELAALLGYQFERELHDAPFPNLNAYLSECRKLFPMTAPDNQEEESPEEDGKAYQTINGLELINDYQEQGDNLNILNLIDNADHQDQVRKILRRLVQSLDAVSDLLVAESVFHIAKGNRSRSASVLKSLNNDKAVETPEITKTPAKGKILSHVIGVQFDLEKKDKIWAGVISPRAFISPHLNRWIADHLPRPDHLCFKVDVEGQLYQLSLRNLVAQPIDVLAFFREKNPLAPSSELSYFIRKYARKTWEPALESPIKVLYRDRSGFREDQKTLFEVKPLFEILNKIISDSRPMFPTDLQVPSRSRPLEASAHSTVLLEDLISRFDTMINGYELYSIVRVKNNTVSFLKECKKTLDGSVSEEKTQYNYEVLHRLLTETAYFFNTTEDFNIGFKTNPERMTTLIEKVEKAVATFERTIAKAEDLLEKIKTQTHKKTQWEQLETLAELLFGPTIKIFPEFTPADPEEFQAALQFPDLLADAPDFAKEEWLQGLAKVQPKVKAFQKLDIYKELFSVKAKANNLQVMQLPYEADTSNYRWLGTAFSPRIKLDENHLSCAIGFPDQYQAGRPQSGMIIDSWTEKIQEPTQDTSIALHYNQSDAEPPQTMLLCISPAKTGKWQWDDLISTVTDTMEMAKKRAVEPASFKEDDADRPVTAQYISGSPLRFLLPAIAFPVSNTQKTPAVGFDAAANHF